MHEIAISVEHVSKVFNLPHERTTSIKGAVVNFWRRDRSIERLNALSDVSFKVEKGDFFGIVGRNGSGKSTLLKLIAGIYSPTSGNIQVNGKLTPFIELGVGFSPELTGRENVFLNGSLLGFSRKQMEAMYEEIVSFAELERFMDQKLKNYSSGMQVRLAFSIAIRARSAILLLDEVLAVGDEAFQRKCFDYFESLKRNKQTVVIVTHDMAAVERFCNKAIFIEDGLLKLSGAPHEVAAAYSRSNDENYKVEEMPVPIKGEDAEEEQDTYIKSKIDIKLYNEQGVESKKFTAGDMLTVKLSWPQIGVDHAGVAILRQSGEYIFGPNTYQEHFVLKKKNNITYKVRLNLSEGTYFIKAGLFGRNDKQQIDFEDRGPIFAVNRDKNDVRWGGVTKLEHEWIS